MISIMAVLNVFERVILYPAVVFVGISQNFYSICTVKELPLSFNYGWKLTLGNMSLILGKFLAFKVPPWKILDDFF